MGKPMKIYLISIILVLTLGTTGAKAQDVDNAFYKMGEEIFWETCSDCHGEKGEGDAPAFPALNGNNKLADLKRIVTNIYQGRENMPPFPELDVEQIAAVATYIRNAWDNAHGGVQVSQVAVILEGLEVGVAQTTVWDAIFTETQAKRGAIVYSGVCSHCHGNSLNGAPEDPDMNSSPPVGRAKFLRNWEGRSMATLFAFTRATMPNDNPGYLDDEAYIDIIAYMLATSNLPAGDTELSTDPEVLARIVITQKP